MARRNQQSRTERHSLKYIWDSQKGATIKLSDPVHAGNAPLASGTTKTIVETDSSPNQMLSTGQFVKVIGQIWSYASHPLSDRGSPENRDVNCADCQKDGFTGMVSGSDNSQERIVGYPHPKLQSKRDLSSVDQEVSAFGIHSGDCDSSSLPGPSSVGSLSAMEFFDKKLLPGVQISKEMRTMYEWMSRIYPHDYNMGVHFGISLQEDRNEKDHAVRKDSSSCLSSSLNGQESPVAENMVSRTTDSKSALIYQNTLSYRSSNTLLLFSRTEISSPKADCLFRAINVIEKDIQLSRTTTSSSPGLHFGSSATYTDTFQEPSGYIDVQSNRRQIHLGDEADIGGKETIISSENRSQISPVKQQHAVAGALAGICVSLCLHPVDTVKTVLQSCRIDQKSICDIGRSIVSERGFTGLYRGIASNIASSAPISAVYTFTYESVKGVLLPLFPKEYCSVAHCTAGGCASVATSFLFTPSDRIKQQMQVRSNYQNCWSALVGVIQKGGLSSLYAGWGAVLCRNVPHSIVKFYAYENLKRSMMSSLQCDKLTTFQTLACGGIAGSTAALFTTPFDVVKTRLQTQTIEEPQCRKCRPQ
uniref:Mitochondrial carrier protein n=1 Tax=Kalanchoe fedtschenkoi TaxID=63787 RepID=A0A7N0TQV4_KALFE